MNTLTVPRAITGAGVFLTAAIVSLFFTPNPHEIDRTPIIIDGLPNDIPIDGTQRPVIPIFDQKTFDELQAKFEEQKIQNSRLASRNNELMDELKKVNLQLEKEKNINTKKPDTSKEDGKSKTKPKQKIVQPDYLNQLISKVSKRGLSFGWIFDVLNAMTGYTVLLMVLRNIWDLFNPSSGEDKRMLKSKLQQKARMASIRASINGRNTEIPYVEPQDYTNE